MTPKRDSATWSAIRARLAEAQIDLSDYSDEFVAGFVAGWEHARDGVGADGEPLQESEAQRTNRIMRMVLSEHLSQLEREAVAARWL